ncbi:MAG: hypothetical protein FH756_05820 [Firmicutes bacterium]|nr:hypothetical protein [Bacillota bacterium]
MSSEQRSRLIKNAIIENTRYLTGSYTYKAYRYMQEKNIIENDKIYYRDEENSKIDYKKTIIANFDNDRQVMLDFFDEHEYIKPYKYGVVKSFDIDYDNLNKKLDELVDKSVISIEPRKYDSQFSNPRLVKDDELFSIKFSYAIGTRADEADWFAYPIILNICPKNGFMLISFDSFPYIYYTRKDFYQYIARSVVNWVEEKLGVKTIEIKLLEMVNDIINIKNNNENCFNDVKEYVRDGYDKRGGRFRLTADDDDEMSFLDQLKKIAESLSTESDKNKLRKLIYDISNNMYFVERGLTWKKCNTKKVNMTMTFRDNFIPNEMILIHFYKNKWDKERIIYGIEYIINYKKKIGSGTGGSKQVG